MRIYIDTSALCCEFDDQTIEANSRDSSAVQHILGLVKLGVWELCDSGVLRDEIGDDPWKLRKMASRKKLRLATAYARKPDAAKRARTVAALGFDAMDAFHIASAEQLCAEWLLTRDREVLDLAKQNRIRLNVRVATPSEFLIWLKGVLK